MRTTMLLVLLELSLKMLIIAAVFDVARYSTHIARAYLEPFCPKPYNCGTRPGLANSVGVQPLFDLCLVGTRGYERYYGP